LSEGAIEVPPRGLQRQPTGLLDAPAADVPLIATQDDITSTGGAAVLSSRRSVVLWNVKSVFEALGKLAPKSENAAANAQ
jgi:hypothetical protein